MTAPLCTAPLCTAPGCTADAPAWLAGVGPLCLPCAHVYLASLAALDAAEAAHGHVDLAEPRTRQRACSVPREAVS